MDGMGSAFEIEGQLAGQITNVGGDQNTFVRDSESGGSVFGRVVALLARRQAGP
jgi:hypothetical protein